jgi:hypothetical protein
VSQNWPLVSQHRVPALCPPGGERLTRGFPRALDWSEWRLVGGWEHEKTEEYIPFAPEEMTAIYLGCRMSNADKKAMMEFSYIEKLDSVGAADQRGRRLVEEPESAGQRRRRLIPASVSSRLAS